MDGDPSGEAKTAVLTTVVERNIQALLARRQQEEEKQTVQDRIAMSISNFFGSMLLIYFHLFIFGLWIAINVGWLPFPHFDPSLVFLAVTATIEALFLSSFVLITQNRMAIAADKRADLHLQIGLLAEHEVTRLLALVSAVAEKRCWMQLKRPSKDCRTLNSQLAQHIERALAPGFVVSFWVVLSS
jgi:uncharacterized membrane protein